MAAILSAGCIELSNPSNVAAVTIFVPSTSLGVGATMQAAAIPVSRAGAALSSRDVEWETSNSSVATVSSGGRISGVAAGTAEIRATSEGQVGRVSITVTAP